MDPSHCGDDNAWIAPQAMPRDRNATRRGERWRSVHETICWLLLIRACAPRPSVNHPARARQARTTSQPGQPQPGWFACRALMPRLTIPSRVPSFLR